MSKENIEVDAEEVKEESRFEEIKEKIHRKINRPSKWEIAKRKINGIVPILSVAIFLLIGFLTDKWHPTWLIFLSSPLIAVMLELFEGNKRQKWVAFISIVLVASYCLVGFVWHIWHPTWVAFFLIPIISILIGKEH